MVDLTDEERAAVSATMKRLALLMDEICCCGARRCPWRDLPDDFGKWNTVFKRFRRWVLADAFYCMFKALAEDSDFEYAMIDVEPSVRHRSEHRWRGIVKVHRPPLGD